MTADPFAIHRVDTDHLDWSSSQIYLFAGKYEERQMPIDVAEPDAYDLRVQDYDDEQDDIGIGWVVFAVVCIVAFFAFGVYANW